MEYILMEAAQKTATQKKYKCPYCNMRFERNKLHIHIQDKHEELIPEGYTALRVAFNTINKKTEGHCIMCKNVTKWNEDKGRYERLCDNPKCHEAYRQMAADRNKSKYGVERLQSDPKYAEEVQRKALAGRRIAGKYRFADGGEIEFLGTYEKKFLEFMDKVMMCKSEDIVAPGPAILYNYEGKEHIYLPDFYYIPYNLLIEIKDGGTNPNQNPAMYGYKHERQQAKENAVKTMKQYNYVRLTDNNFGQLLQMMAVLKFNLQSECYDPVMMINESALNESESISFSSDKELSDYMKKNISYKNFTKLMSAEDVLKEGKGSCHDQVMFELKYLGNMGYHPKAMFFIECNDKGEGGETHSFVYYTKNNKTYWFENAWGGKEGIHEFDSKEDIVNHIKELHKSGKTGNVKKYDSLEFTSFKHHIPGETLQEFVNVCFGNKESMKESDMSGTIGAALPIAPVPVPFESQPDNYYAVVHHDDKDNCKYSITKDPLQYTMFSVDPLDKNFYKVYKTDKSKISKKYLTFKIKDSQTAKELYDELAIIEANTGNFYADDTSENYIYKILTHGSKLLTEDQILFDDRFELVRDFVSQLHEDCEAIRIYIMPSKLDILEEQINSLMEDL